MANGPPPREHGSLENRRNDRPVLHDSRPQYANANGKSGQGNSNKVPLRDAASAEPARSGQAEPDGTHQDSGSGFQHSIVPVRGLHCCRAQCSRSASAGALAAAKGLFKLSPRIQVPEETLRGVTERLRTDALSHREAELRLKSARALAYPGQNNRDFLRQLLQTETDPEIRRFLTLASQEYPTE